MILTYSVPDNVTGDSLHIEGDQAATGYAAGCCLGQLVSLRPGEGVPCRLALGQSIALIQLLAQSPHQLLGRR